GRGVKEKNQVSVNDATKVVGVSSDVEEPTLSSLGGPTVEKVTENNDDTQEGNVEQCSALITSIVVPNEGIATNLPISYVKLVTHELSRKSVNFRTLITSAGNGADVAVPLESIQAFSSKDGLDAMLENGPWFIHNNLLILKKWDPDVDLLKEDVDNVPVFELQGIGHAVVLRISYREWRNLKNPRQVARIVQVGIKVAFKPLKQVYRHVSNRNNSNSSGKNKQAAVASKEVSNSKPFDVLNSVEKNDDLGTNGEHSKLDGKGPKSNVFSSEQGSFNVASSITSTTPIVKRIDKIERQIIDRKLTLVDDDGKPLPKVVPSKNMDSDSEVEDVVDDHPVCMASTCLKCGADSEYGTNSLLEQWKTKKRADDYDSYDDDLYESHNMSETL
ncbi:putative reverse transcriptase domain-containing protein, partial [Tanacetum coccineum]